MIRYDMTYDMVSGFREHMVQPTSIIINQVYFSGFGAKAPSGRGICELLSYISFWHFDSLLHIVAFVNF